MTTADGDGCCVGRAVTLRQIAFHKTFHKSDLLLMRDLAIRAKIYFTTCVESRNALLVIKLMWTRNFFFSKRYAVGATQCPRTIDAAFREVRSRCFFFFGSCCGVGDGTGVKYYYCITKFVEYANNIGTIMIQVKHKPCGRGDLAPHPTRGRRSTKHDRHALV
jgi:hypothetical protein